MLTRFEYAMLNKAMAARPDWVVLPMATAPRLPIQSFASVQEAADWARTNEPYLGAWTVRAGHDELIDWSK